MSIRFISLFHQFPQIDVFIYRNSILIINLECSKKKLIAIIAILRVKVTFHQ